VAKGEGSSRRSGRDYWTRFKKAQQGTLPKTTEVTGGGVEPPTPKANRNNHITPKVEMEGLWRGLEKSGNNLRGIQTTEPQRRAGGDPNHRLVTSNGYRKNVGCFVGGGVGLCHQENGKFVHNS